MREALLAAGIPRPSKKSLKKNPGVEFRGFLWQFRKPSPMYHLEIRALGRDFPRAEAMIEQMEADEKAAGKDDN